MRTRVCADLQITGKAFRPTATAGKNAKVMLFGNELSIQLIWAIHNMYAYDWRVWIHPVHLANPAAHCHTSSPVVDRTDHRTCRHAYVTFPLTGCIDNGLIFRGLRQPLPLDFEIWAHMPFYKRVRWTVSFDPHPSPWSIINPSIIDPFRLSDSIFLFVCPCLSI